MNTHLETAARIGRTLADEAVWHEGRCTWVGCTGDDASPPGYATLPADLDVGVAGVGLFLAHLAEATGDQEARRAAQGAVRQALWLVARSPDASDDGLYAGPLGVALAAVRAGSILGDHELHGGGVRLARRCAGADRAGELDLVRGASGRIVALLALRDRIGGEVAIDAARVTSADLVARAGEVSLTGLSCGMSGAGLALLELWAVTGEPEPRDAGEALLTAERTYFDPGLGNWADLRDGEVDGVHSYAVAWCHGAPGIALARLRALELTGAPELREEALVALRTTDRHARAALRGEGFDLSLRHGLAGLAEVLVEGEDALRDAWPDGRAFAAEVAEAAFERHATGELPWPCGVPFGQTPALMTGLAGIGLFHLRLHDPTIPSVLLVRPPTALPAAAGPSRSAEA